MAQPQANTGPDVDASLYTCTTPIFRGCFLNLFDGEDIVDEKTKEVFKKWSATMLFTKGEQLTELKEKGRALMTALHGPDPKAWPAGWWKPWRDQAEKAKDNPHAEKKYDGFESGALFCNGSSYYQPQVFDRVGNIIMDKKLIFNGCWFRANVTVKWFNNKSKGLKLQMNALQFIRADKPLGGGAVDFAKAFAPLEVDAAEGAAAVFEDIDPMS